ncbi:hypothetical protein NKG94_31050 [Micromonospora sp. M12]
MSGGIGWPGAPPCAWGGPRSGVLVLPAVAVRAAGPASLLAWAALLALSALIATTFADLGARYPDVGGSPRSPGGPSVTGPPRSWAAGCTRRCHSGGRRGGGRRPLHRHRSKHPPAATAAIAVALLAVVFLTNLLVLRVSGRLQLALTGALIALLVTVITVAGPHVDPHRVGPFAPTAPPASAAPSQCCSPPSAGGKHAPTCRPSSPMPARCAGGRREPRHRGRALHRPGRLHRRRPRHRGR